MITGNVSLGAFLWRRRLDSYDDADLAAKLRDNAAWRAELLAEQDVLRLAAYDGLPGAAAAVTRWDTAVELLFEGITRPLLEEAKRRTARCRSRGRGTSITSVDLVTVFGDRLHAMPDGTYKATCPWHADSRPSLTIYVDGHCHCFACGAHRPVTDLARVWTEAAA